MTSKKFALFSYYTSCYQATQEFPKIFPINTWWQTIKQNKIIVSVIDCWHVLLRLTKTCETKVNQSAQICLIIEAKSGDNPLKCFIYLLSFY